MSVMTAGNARKMADAYVAPDPVEVLMKRIDERIQRAAMLGGGNVVLSYRIVDNDGYWTNELPNDWKKSVVGNLRERGFEVSVSQSDRMSTPRSAAITVSW